MPNIRSLQDIQESTSQTPLSHFAGGEKSGLAIQDSEEKKSHNAASQPFHLILYENGFKAPDQDFEPVDKESYDAFVNELMAGLVPNRLRDHPRLQNRSAVHVTIEKRQEDFKLDQKQNSPLFAGRGETLNEGEKKKDIELRSIKDFCFDKSEPLTSLLIKFPSVQSRQTFNTNTTIGQLLDYISSQVVDPHGIIVKTGYPPQSISGDRSETIEGCGLKNATVHVMKR